MAQQSSLWLRAVLCGGFICAAFSGNQLAGAVRYQRTANTSAFFFYLEITNRTFNKSLLDPTSVYYKSLRSEVKVLMDTVYKCSSCSTQDIYHGISEMSFSEGSLVIAKMTLVFHTRGINAIVVKYLFINRIIENPPKDLEINTEYTRDVQTPVIATTTLATPTTPMPTHTTVVNSTSVTTFSSVTSQGATIQVGNQGTSLTLDPSPRNSTSSKPTSLPDPKTKDPSGNWKSTVYATTKPGISNSLVTPHSNGITGAGWSSTPSNTNNTEVTLSYLPSSNTSLSPATSTSASASVQYMTDHAGTHEITTPQSENQGMTTTAYDFGSSNSQPYWWDWVPGWGIALLVQTALILLFLIFLFIMLLVTWCCIKDKKHQLPVSEAHQQSTPSPAPTYVSHSPSPVLKDMATGGLQHH